MQHPDSARLAAFGQGTLDHGELAEIETHLAVCESCCDLLSSLPDDEFVDRLRASQKLPGWATEFCGDVSVAVTVHAESEATGFEVPSSFVFSDLSSGSEIPLTVDAVGRSGPRPREFPLEQELPSELLNHPRYRIVRKLGAGGMGSVYLAQHQVMDRPVALKVIRSDLLGKPALVERFRREVKSAAHLALHPNIVAAYDAEQAGDSHFLVMEFVDGVNLGDLVKSQGPLPVEAACDAIKQAAEGLEHAHQRGMVHRDIKPQNLMRTANGQIKILDFGLARLASEVLPDLAAAAEEDGQQHVRSMTPDGGIKLTLTDMVLGSADYIAPEQALDPRSADIRADIYSLGCTLYHLLAGEPPFPDGNLTQKLAAHAERAPNPLSELRQDVPPTLIQIVDQMMAKDRDHRFQRPAELAEALARFCEKKSEQPPYHNELRERYGEAFSRLETDARAVELSDGGVPRQRKPIKEGHSVDFVGQNNPRSWPPRFSAYWRRRPFVKVATVLLLLVVGAAAVTVRLITIKPGEARKQGHPLFRSKDQVAASPRPTNRTLAKTNPGPAPETKPAAAVDPAEPAVAAKVEAFRKANAYWNRDFLKKAWDVDRLASDTLLENALGRELHDVIVDLNPTLQDNELLLRVIDTAEPLIKTVSRKGVRYTFTVLDTDAVNAFSHPGGYIYVTRGLFNLIAEDESYALQFVLGHEMAHIELRHAIKCLQDPGLRKPPLGPLGTIQKLYGVIIPSAYLDDQEFEADAWVFTRMRGLELDRTNRECFAFLNKLDGYATNHGFAGGRARPKLGDYSLIDNHLPAHTAPFTRLQHLKKIRDEALSSPK